MIRLVATDVDGTLLDSQKRVPPAFDALVGELEARSIRFVIASGRQYFNLLKTFPSSAERLYFICENGAIVFRGHELLFDCPIPDEKLLEVLAAIREIPGAFPIFCGVKSAYVEDDDPGFREQASHYYERCRKVDALPDMIGHDRICKIAVYDANGAEEHTWRQVQHFRDRFAVTLAGTQWVDFMRSDVTKGTAMAFLQREFGIEPEHCMAFGDYLNDLELMKSCFHSYAMANAHPGLAEVCRFRTAKSNDENGVIDTLKTYFADKGAPLAI